MSEVNLVSMSDDELLAHRADQMRTLALSLFQLRTGQLQNTSVICNLRRGVARANTELRVREAAQGLIKGSLLSRTVGRKQRGEAAEGADTSRRSRFGLGPIREAIVNGRAR